MQCSSCGFSVGEQGFNTFASRDAKLAMFLQYCDLLNALEIGSTTKITINNRRMTKGSFAQNLLRHKDDGLDVYRDEYNSMIMDAAIRGNGIIQDKYITVSVIKNTYEEAKTFFNRVYAELSSRFAAMSSSLSELDVPERMRIFHDFFRMGEEENYYFELQDLMRRGHSFQDSICPDSMTISGKSRRVHGESDRGRRHGDHRRGKRTDCRDCSRRLGRCCCDSDRRVDCADRRVLLRSVLVE